MEFYKLRCWQTLPILHHVFVNAKQKRKSALLTKPEERSPNKVRPQLKIKMALHCSSISHLRPQLIIEDDICSQLFYSAEQQTITLILYTQICITDLRWKFTNFDACKLFHSEQETILYHVFVINTICLERGSRVVFLQTCLNCAYLKHLYIHLNYMSFLFLPGIWSPLDCLFWLGC